MNGGLAPGAKAQGTSFQSPTIVILGDNQIPFGSEPGFLEFFENITSHCPPTEQQRKNLEVKADMKVAAIGARSTSLHSWTATMGRAKGAIAMWTRNGR